ncbi:MAG: radical SAM protein [bacterium]|nr:radical SAM protein [bacterium]
MSAPILLISVQQTLDVIGLKYVHYSLIENSYDSMLLFISAARPTGDDLEEIGAFVRRLSPRLIGLSLVTIDTIRARIITSYLKEHFNDIPVIWGGYHPTVQPGQCLEYADYVCIGEAEKVIVDIARAMDLNKPLRDINGLCYKENNRVKKNPIYPLEENIDSTCLHDHIPRNSYILHAGKVVPLTIKLFRKHDRFGGKILYIMSSRGCPLACTYCCNSFFSRLYNSNRVRRRSVTNILAEIEKALHHHPEIEYIDFLDDCFMAADRDYIDKFCTRYKEKIDKPFISKITPTFVTRERISALKTAGLAWVGLGLQSGSDRINREIYHRNSLSTDFLEAARICHEFKIAVYYDIILDNPYETETEKLQTIRILMAAPKPCLAKFYSLTYYPGSELYERIKIDMPDKVAGEDVLTKDHILYNQERPNDMIRLAAYLHPRLMLFIVHLYKHHPGSFTLTAVITMAKLLCAALFEPWNFFQSIKLSQSGSYLKTITVIPIYLQEGIRNYFNQFTVLRSKVTYSSDRK